MSKKKPGKKQTGKEIKKPAESSEAVKSVQEAPEEQEAEEKADAKKPDTPKAETAKQTDTAPAAEKEKASPDDETKADNEEDWTTTENVYERIAKRDSVKSEPKLTTVHITKEHREAAEEKAPAPEPVSQSSSGEKKYSGPPLTEEQRRRIAAMENLLDHDLDEVRARRDEADLAARKREEAQKKKEQERLERLKASQKFREQQEAHAKENAKLREEREKEKEKEQKNTRTTAGGAHSHGTSKVRKNAVDRSFNSNVIELSFLRIILAVIVILALAYAGLFLYSRNINDAFFNSLAAQLTSQNRLVTDQSMPYVPPASAGMTADEKTNKSLELGVADSDYDGLSDLLEDEIGSNPLNSDTNGNKIPDGAEYMTGNDPAAPANDTITDKLTKDITVGTEGLTAVVKGAPISADISVEKIGNHSINGTPGLIGQAYSFYSTGKCQEVQLTFAYPVNTVQKKGYNENALSVFEFDPNELDFKQIPSTRNDAAKTITATVPDNGIYAVCDTSIMMQNGKTQIFFVIDNSGSMYSEKLCKGSEENDIEFKRLDFAINLIDMIGDQAIYGAGEFSGDYKNIVAISDDRDKVKNEISDLRNVVPPFSGTNIPNAVDHAIKEFGTINAADKNYIILLTDGMSTSDNPTYDQTVIDTAQKYNITIFTVGLGKNIDADYLSHYASSTNGQFFQATNADALAFIYEKIEHFMSYNRVELEKDTGRTGFIVADSGFKYQRDGLGYNNFRSDFAPNGADVGIAGLISDYYTGALQEKAEGYTTNDGKKIPGYDISGITELKNGKVDLKDIKVEILDSYGKYLLMNDKWAFNNVKANLLGYTPETRDFIDNAGLRVITAPYEFKAPEETDIEKLLRTITFSQVRSFDRYECVLIDSSYTSGADKEVLNMIQWYCYLPYTSNCEIYDFGYDGDYAFEALVSELSTGNPAVVIYNGSALNAVRLTRDTKDPMLFVLDAYDSNSPERMTKIELRRSPLYTNDHSSYQYSATRNGTSSPLQIIIK